MNSDMNTTLCKSASDWIQMHIQGNIYPVLCILCSPLTVVSLFYDELIILLEAISAVFNILTSTNQANQVE